MQKKSRENLEKHQGPDHPATRFSKAVEARLRVSWAGQEGAEKDFERLLQGEPGRAEYISVDDLYIERLRVDMLRHAGRDEKVESILKQMETIILDEPAAVLIKDFNHRALLGRSDLRVSASRFLQDAGTPIAATDLLQPSAAIYHDSWVDVAFCIRRDGSVDEISVGQSQGHKDWPRRVAKALEARRYVAWRSENPSIDCISKFQRFAVAVGIRDRVGSRIKGPSAFSEVVITDLLGDDGGLGVDFSRPDDNLGR